MSLYEERKIELYEAFDVIKQICESMQESYLENLTYDERLGVKYDKTLVYDEKNPEERFIANKLIRIRNLMFDTISEYNYISRDEVYCGLLHRNKNGRFQLGNRELHCGSIIEVAIPITDEDPDGKEYQMNAWVVTDVQHNQKDYYLTKCPDLPMEGLPARYR